MVKEQLYCLIRKTWVAAFPEEIVRQKLLAYMTQQLGYPVFSITLEKRLDQLPHLAQSPLKLPDRRADLICLAKDIHPSCSLFPLLVVECKAVPITQKVMNQVIGYNHYLQARYVCVANGSEIKTGWFDKSQNGYCFVNHLIPYEELLNYAKLLRTP